MEGHGHEQEMTAEKLRLTCMLDDNRTRVELDDEFAPNDTMKWPQLMSYRNCLRRCLDDESKHQPTHSRLVLKWTFKHPQKKGQIVQTVRVALNKKLWWWKENYFGAMGGALFMRLCTIHGLGKRLVDTFKRPRRVQPTCLLARNMFVWNTQELGGNICV